jgi:2-keto-4-pentenoate hydratase/2-oxohepta-3-ene-1,7-dioic acid hydratase in catechol pathway
MPSVIPPHTTPTAAFLCSRCRPGLRSRQQPGSRSPSLAGFQRLDPGDLLLTGTPGGTALQAPPAVVAKMGDLLLPMPLKWRVFFSRQQRSPAYLKAGDVITASIASRDGVLDLGTQCTVVRDRPS